jgi:hypothetical protein
MTRHNGSRGRAALSLAVLAVAMSVPQQASAQAARPATIQATVAITNVTVIPMDRERTLADQTVIIRDGRIETVGDAARTTVPAGATRIDGRGKFLMPGLAEMHAHVPPGNPTDEQLNDIMFLYVANGVTTIRGMLGAPYQIELRRRLASGELLGPRFFAAAPSLNGNSAPNPAAAVAAVRAAKAAGYDLMKIHPGLSLETWDVAVAELKAQGMTFAGHVPAAVGVVHAMQSGIATIDHVDGYLEASVRDSSVHRTPGSTMGEMIESIDNVKFRELAEMTARLGVWNVPTMYLWENFYGNRSPEELGALPEMRYAHPDQVNAWKSQRRNRSLGDANQGLTPERRERYLLLRREMLKALADAGAPLLMGTDSPQMFNVPGFALHRELQVARAAGLSRYQVLESGTRNVGRYVASSLKQDGAFGTVAAGQWADLVLLDGNPLEDLENLTRRSGVFVRGRWVSAAEITEGLNRLAAKYAALRQGGDE